MARNVIDRDLGLKRIIAELKKADDMSVAVGILQGSKNGEGFAIAEYAAANEFGTDKIPSRPFMRTAFDENKGDIQADMDRQYGRLVTGKITANTGLTIIGQKHADRIKYTITGRNFLPKLAQATIDAKNGSTKTLVDTGAMKNAVQISIRSK